MLEGLFDGDLMVLRGVRPVQELAGAALLRDLRALVARQLAEAVRAVHDGVERGHLGVPEHEVGVCGRRVICVSFMCVGVIFVLTCISIRWRD